MKDMNEKTSAVRYFSKTGNTKKLAIEIANAAGCEAYTIEKPLKEKVDVLFLGASVYWGGIDSQVKDFIRTLDGSKIGKVAVFSTSALAQRAYPEIKKLLLSQGIKTAEEDFYCRGQFKVMHRERPDAEDLKAAGKYAEVISKGLASEKKVAK